MDKKIILYTIFYLALTSFFIYLFLKEKAINKKVELKIEKLSEKLSKILGIKEEKKKKILLKIIKTIESFGTAIVLVLIIQRFYLGNFMVPTGSMKPTIMPKDRLFGNMVSYKFREPKREEIVVFKEPLENKVLYTKRLMGLSGEEVQIKNNHLYVNGKKIETREYTPLGELGNGKWIVPKKGDKLTIAPKENYKKIYSNLNVNIEEIQKMLTKDSSRVKEILPEVKFFINNQKTGMILDFIHEDKVLEKLLNGEKIEIEIKDNYYLVLGDNTNGSYDSRMWGFVKKSRIRGKAIIRFWPITKLGILK